MKGKCREGETHWNSRPGKENGPKPRPWQERFWAKVVKSDGCWEWIGAKTPQGYGQFKKSKGEMSGAHRIAYELVIGAIPEALTIDHMCRNRGCCNPEHLDPCTLIENVRRAKRRRLAEKNQQNSSPSVGGLL